MRTLWRCWCNCCKSDEWSRWISRPFWECNWSRYRDFWCCCWWDDWLSCWWNCWWDFIFLSIAASSRSEFIHLLRCMMLTNVLVKFILWIKDPLAMLANDFLANWSIMLQQANQERERRKAIQTRVILRRETSKRSRSFEFRRRFRRKCSGQDL